AAILDRVVLGADGQALVLGIQARAARHGPALQDAVDLEAEVVVQARRVMLLDDVAPSLRPTLGSLRLRRLGEPPFRAIGIERGAGPARGAGFPLLSSARGHESVRLPFVIPPRNRGSRDAVTSLAPGHRLPRGNQDKEYDGVGSVHP